jgi:intracellular sulfur oxidation DsrE/DsrF family protein
MSATPLAKLAAFVVFSCAAIPALAQDASVSHYVQPQISHADYGDINIVMPLSQPDEGVWQARMGHALNAVLTAPNWNGHANVVIVVYGPAIKIFTHRGDKIAAQMDELRAAGVKFEACNNSLRGFDLDWHQLHGVAESDIVPAGILEVPVLEKKGYQLASE